MPIRRAYGALQDTFDPNDYRYSKVVAPTKRPDFVDLEVPGEPIWDQGQLGSCWWNALAAEINDVQPDFYPSRLWGYYKSRVRMRTTHEDSGTASRPALHVLTHQGCAPETDWPYAIDNFALAPPHRANADAKGEVIEAYRRLRTKDEMLDCLASGRSFMLGLALCDEFESDQVANDGMVPMPRTGQIIGLHEMQVKGYRMGAQYDGGGLVKLRNSWARDWGDRGYCYFPLAYLREPQLVLDAYVLDHCHPRAVAA
jgi:hypothetical protein